MVMEEARPTPKKKNGDGMHHEDVTLSIITNNNYIIIKRVLKSGADRMKKP